VALMADPPYDYWFGPQARAAMWMLCEEPERKDRKPATSRLLLHRTFKNGKRVITAEYRPYATKVLLKQNS
jgi:hypothetical protein